jgi:hypothetical protein
MPGTPLEHVSHVNKEASNLNVALELGPEKHPRSELLSNPRHCLALQTMYSHKRAEWGI